MTWSFNKNSNFNIDEEKIEHLYEIINVIKTGNRLSSYFFFKEHTNFKNKKEADVIFNYLFDSFL